MRVSGKIVVASSFAFAGVLCTPVLALDGSGGSMPGAGQSIPAATSSASQTRPEIRYVSATTLNLRAAPSTEAAKVGTLETGTAVSVLEEDEDWVWISVGDENYGYVNAQYLSRR